MHIPKPSDLGLSSKFKDWRPNQLQAVEDGLQSKKRFIAQVMRTGSGKSVMYIAIALLSPNTRTLVLTSTKGLQDQLLDDFAEIGMVDIRGKSSYTCGCDPTRTCEEGQLAKCLYKASSMCPHTAAKFAAATSSLVTTNYSCWIASNKYGNGFGKFDILVLDEAHNAPEELCKAMQVRLSFHEIAEMLKREWPGEREIGDMKAWKHWSLVTKAICDAKIEPLKKSIEREKHPKNHQLKELHHLRNLSRKLADVATCNPDKWICDEWQYGYQFDPTDAAEYGERILFHGVEKVILTSGTIRPKTLKMLGIRTGDYDFFDYPSDINPSKSPLIYIPTVKVWRGSTESELRRLVRRIDEIFESRADRKGIIHTSNYKMRDYIMSNSQYSNYFVSNYTQNGDITSEVVEQFKRMKAPAVLVSPSVTTGYDFPYDTARYQIVAKLPFPDDRSKIDQARLKLDRERSAYHTMQALTQMFGRADRAEDDFQECFIIDDNVEWFMWKYKHLAPTWLPAYYRKMSHVPEAPELMEVV